ncbi:hypothetical protein LguiA_005407 [Lonicera macranthoides]
MASKRRRGHRTGSTVGVVQAEDKQKNEKKKQMKKKENEKKEKEKEKKSAFFSRMIDLAMGRVDSISCRVISGSGGTTKSEHDLALEKLEKITDPHIFKKLAISYDCLPDDHNKSLFLEIACFFLGKDKDYMCLWHGLPLVYIYIERMR